MPNTEPIYTCYAFCLIDGVLTEQKLPLVFLPDGPRLIRKWDEWVRNGDPALMVSVDPYQLKVTNGICRCTQTISFGLN